MFLDNDISHFLFKEISKSEFNTFIERINDFLNKENINKVINFLSINSNSLSDYKKIIVLIFLELSGNNKECLKIVETIDEEFLIEIVKEKIIYNKLPRNIRQMILSKLSKSKWLSNYKGQF